MKKKPSFTIIVLILSLYSCNTNRYIYSASAPNNPYFTKKGESKLTADYSSLGKSESTTSSSGDITSSANQKGFSNGLDLQGGYAISNHLAFIAGYQNKREKDIYDHSAVIIPFKSSTVKYRRNLFETGIGYYVALNSEKTITFNFYTGIAGGKFSFNDNGIDTSNLSYTRYHSANIRKWFLQPSFNFMPGNYIRFSVILRTSFVHYGHINTSYTASEIMAFSLGNIVNKTLDFYEPATNLQFGIPKYSWIKLDLTLAAVAGDPFYAKSIRHLNSSIGLSVDFSKMKEKKP